MIKEDYDEPRGHSNVHPEYDPIPTARVIDRLDTLLAQNDYDAAERHLNYWLSEAERGNDRRGKLTVLNEQIGLYRKLGRREDGMPAIRSALALAEEFKMPGVTLGTTLINAATGLSSFGEYEDALPLYRRAQELFEALLPQEDVRLGGLYNNMALTVMALGDFRESKALFFKAIGVMNAQEHGDAEIAITYLNLADLVSAELGADLGRDTIRFYLHKAKTLLDGDTLPRDSYYAFVCEKCAPIFGFYGFDDTEKELRKRAKAIYERS